MNVSIDITNPAAPSVTLNNYTGSVTFNDEDITSTIIPLFKDYLRLIIISESE
jgi:hypothetical protein